MKEGVLSFFFMTVSEFVFHLNPQKWVAKSFSLQLVNKPTSFIFCLPAPGPAAASESTPTVLYLPGPSPVAIFTAAVSTKAEAPSCPEGHVPGPCPLPTKCPSPGLQYVF